MKILKIFMYVLLLTNYTYVLAFEIIGVTFLDTNLSVDLDSEKIVVARGYDTVETYGRSEIVLRRLERKAAQIREDELLRKKRDSYNRRRYDRLRRELKDVDLWENTYRKPRKIRRYYEDLSW